ncbi:winged helix-turn-helix transcriptional regulator [Rhodococcus chondri]|uniref:Helix-turn-helix domain-containing protein n=1 Tax=Rhodococcus chondri TaxID=3065941 RepID=A0ABU7JP83_9NOCA|nr:helix-turn-helix domain-containing protein [Rhodococcus sp. CC-R104]MEE2031704.1 helix-turn-helix domain-containing protein [Rhodococcus sp. CC-R104]
MNRSPLPPDGGSPAVNPVAATLDLLGDRLTLALLGHAFVSGTTRFNQWLERTGAPSSVLTDRLNSLVDAGVLQRSPLPTTPERHEYVLTDLGASTWQILVCIWGWQREWTPEGAWQPDLVHAACGHRGPAVVMCDACGRTVTGHDTDIEMDAEAIWTVTSGARRRSTRIRSRDSSRTDMQFNAVMEAIGDRWSGAITGLALAGARRFGEFRSALDISPTTLTDRLTRLSTAQILERPAGSDREYRLTPRGRALFGVFVFLIRWSTQAYPDVRGPLRIRHRSCGAILTPALQCRGCDAPLDRTAARIESAPAQP